MDDANSSAQADQNQQQNPPASSDDKEVTIGKYKVKVVRNACISAASCVALAAGTFKLDDESKAVILEDSQDSEEAILMAAQSCPTKAIIITDAETGKQVWPE
ncbi:ferredoxin [Candidatus Woesebacteria bacterium]|nr:ferredoxin [Candidatus Woesebacteria bacterium]